jgi:hypothetical protein
VSVGTIMIPTSHAAIVDSNLTWPLQDQFD